MPSDGKLKSEKSALITHKDKPSSSVNLSEIKKRLKNADTLVLPLKQELEMLQEMSEFEFGKFLLSNKGLNGYWTSYLILNRPQKNNLTPLERWILEAAPLALATRERYYIFQEILQENLRNDITIASIPCGVMDDLIHLNTGSFENIKYVGIDYDNESIKIAKKK